ncbi:MAG TPA: ribosome maturation factor RimM [Rhodothermales bacterium]|nr:ribosome maturation factor RimM [Rhodothermales bacterium]
MAIRKTSDAGPGVEAAQDLLLVGRFGRVHGLRGEVKMVPETGDPEHLQELEAIYAGPDEERSVLFGVESVRLQQTKHGVTLIVKLEGVDTPEQADALRQQLVFAREADLPPLEEDELYLHDLIGLSVVTEEGEEVGSISEILEMPGHYMYVVSRPGKPDAWIPAVEEFVADVDLGGGRMVIRPIEGLLD